ncbi:uncharacterized protein [Zea mays]|uniref:Calcium-dependent protein kinase 14 n=1 Tax=Zea mays TaxID=4577 RepID=A0A1D6I823_MAIZE|nr:uncharacterized protein LOC103632978 [Zea mays]ONM56194.1 Calcium-dependent protein kinase 14 [Zea mays]ONM56195.1 Calcium-dependent protein kinase 14 [Zea mays]|eukprot:XP_020396751.1 uncharacterized protein LOC103632978 [Zea mays]
MPLRSETGTAGEGDEEQRLRAALRHLQAEAGVLERLVYKHRNQHRGAAYFQYLLKVRRDLKLLLGAGLAEVLNAVFPVLACRKPANTILVPNKQTKKKPGANHSHHQRLLGVARLLSQMSEPVMKAAIQITFLLARSFFVDLCTAVLSLLARVRVLIQQMLLDVVSIYNKVTDLTERKQAVKISISGVQAFREYYPSMNDACTVLECVWIKDKFVLHEKVKDISQETQVENQKCRDPESTVQYETLALISEDMKILEETNLPDRQTDTALAEQPDKMIHCNDAGDSQKGRQLENESSARLVPDTLSTRKHLKPESRKRVAFVAVGNSKVTGAASEIKSSEVNKKQRLDMISPSNIQSGLYNKLLDCEFAEKSLL